eukprot:10268540-Alexandrium_andersonii.AAC.1
MPSKDVPRPRRARKDARAALLSWKLPEGLVALCLGVRTSAGIQAIEVFSGAGQLSSALEQEFSAVRRFE